MQSFGSELAAVSKLPKWLPSSVRPTAMVIRSDYLLTQKGLDKVVAHLRKSLEFPTVRNRENVPLVCIIGGSHSDDSLAALEWTCR